MKYIHAIFPDRVEFGEADRLNVSRYSGATDGEAVRKMIAADHFSKVKCLSDGSYTLAIMDCFAAVGRDIVQKQAE